MEWNNFKALYSSYFRPLTERDGIEEWQGFVARIPERDAKLLMKAMGELAHIHAEKRLAGADPIAPRIPDLAVLLNRERDGLRRSGASSRGNCPLCKGTRRLIAGRFTDGTKNSFRFRRRLRRFRAGRSAGLWCGIVRTARKVTAQPSLPTPCAATRYRTAYPRWSLLRASEQMRSNSSLRSFRSRSQTFSKICEFRRGDPGRTECFRQESFCCQ